MKKMMLVGRTGCGKTTLSQSMQGMSLIYRKTQAVCYSAWIVDTPGEFTENRRLYSALMASSTSCDVIAFVQDATAVSSVFPPKFASMFNKKTIGIVSKTDLADANLERAEKFLRWAGADSIFHTSALEQTGINTIIAWLNLEATVQPCPSAGNTKSAVNQTPPRSVTQ
jgi:ethanolamine utilization protein EutP